MSNDATRRQILTRAAGLGAASLIPNLGWAAAGGPDYLAAAGLPDGGYCLVGLTEAGTETFRLPLPDRGHAAAAHPSRPEAVAFARRPGTFALVIDCAEGREIARLAAPDGNAFCGHGAFSPDGGLLFTTETGPEPGDGRVGVWDARDGYRRCDAVTSGGVGPHELLLMPDGRRLAIANGGIETQADSGRAKLNLATMQPNLAYLDIASGVIADRLELDPALRLNSIRHLAVSHDGTLAAALQWEGAALETPPLLILHRPGARSLETVAAPEPLQRRTRNYGGSVAFSGDGGSVAITAPKGNLMLVFAVADPATVEAIEAFDICGVARAKAGFACSTGGGAFLAVASGRVRPDAATRSLAFDNHLVAL